MKKLSIILLIYYFLLNPVHPQVMPGDSTKKNPNPTKLLLIGGISIGLFTYGYVIQDNIWWKGSESSFHFNWRNDWTASLGSDKFGHFYLAYLGTNLYQQAFSWAEIDEHKSLLYAMLVMFGYQTFTEIRDGFSKDYGFSWGDLSANVLGITFPYLQSKIELLNAFNFKISYYPSSRFKKGSNKYLIDDYESTYNWLSIDLNRLLPETFSKSFPDFINLAIGHSVKKLDYPNKSYHELFIGLDWDIKALPGNGWFWNLLKKNLNFYHLPAPAIKIYPNTVWYGLKF